MAMRKRLMRWYSGEWCGMSEWKECRLGELGTVVTGKTPSKNNPEDWGDAMPFITPSDYKYYGKIASRSERNLSIVGVDRLSNKVLPVNSILVTCIGSDMGKVAMNQIKVITNQQINSIIPDVDFVNNNFLYYRLVDMYKTLRIYGGDGTAVPIVNKGDFESIETEIPPLPEQRAIASVLSSLDDKIDLLHRQNKTLEAMAETLFRQWFVEEADEGWEQGYLRDVASFHNGKKRPDDIIEGNIRIYGGNGILGYADKSNYEGVTVIIGRVGAYCGSLYIERNPVWISDNALVAKPINKEHSSFLFFLLKSLQLNEMAEGSSHPLLTQTLLRSIQIIIPPEHLIEPFVYQVDTWLNKLDKNNKQIRTLKKLRDALLPKLMIGEVRVSI